VKATGKDNLNLILELNNVELGICYCAHAYFEQDIYHKSWVKKYYTTRSTWGIYPSWCVTKEDKLSALRIRLRNLKKELKTYE